jgi:hypothetical protein
MDSDRRIENIGWALFLIMIGVLWLVPDSIVPQGAWMVGAGLILLGINAVRYVKNIDVNGFSTTLGLFAVVAGAMSVAGMDVPIFPIFLLVVGVMILIRTLFARPSPRVGDHHTTVTV